LDQIGLNLFVMFPQTGGIGIGPGMIGPLYQVISQQHHLPDYFIEFIFRKILGVVPVSEALLKQIKGKSVYVFLQCPDAGHG
jgi:hypothetical protein